MAQIRVFNPSSRNEKAVTYEQAQKRQAKAVRFLRDVADDPDLADEIEDMSVQQYAEHKGLRINPGKKRRENSMKQSDLEAIGNLLDSKIQKLRSNPRRNQAAPVTSPAGAPMTDTSAKDKTKILDTIDNALSAIDDGDPDAAYDLLCDVLDDYSDDNQQ